MKLINLEKKNEGKVVLGILVYNRTLLAISIMFCLIAISCSVSKNAIEVEEQPVRGKIDNTLYDLNYVEGLKQKMDGNYGEAIDKFEDALEINDESDAANYQISQIAAMRRDYKNAIKFGNRAATLDGDNTWYMMNMANIYIQMSMLDSAAIWIEKVVMADPENDNEKYRLGNIYLQTGEDKKAEEIFEDFNNKYSGNEQIIMALVDVKLRLDKYLEAEAIINEELEKGIENVRLKGILAELYSEAGEEEKAAKVYDEIVKNSDNEISVELSYINFLLKYGKYEKLLERIRTLIHKKETTKEQKISIIARLMQDSIIRKEYSDKLIKIGHDLVKENEEDPTVVLMLAEIYGVTGKTDLEIAILIDYIEKIEDQYFVWEKLLIKLNDSNDIKRLSNYSERASKLFNRAPLPKIFFAFTLIENGKLNQAKDELKKVRILVNNEEIYLVQILSMEAEIEYRSGNIEMAAKKFDRALEIEHENPLVLNNYAYYLAEEGIRLKEAQDMIEQCLGVEENITYLDTYAWVLYKRGKYRNAEKVMLRIFKSGKIEDAELIEHYGYIKKAVGSCDEAIVLWQNVLRIDKKRSYLISEIEKCVKED